MDIALVLQRADIAHAAVIGTWQAALIVQWAAGVRTGVDHRAGKRRQQGPRRPAVILQWSQQRVSAAEVGGVSEWATGVGRQVVPQREPIAIAVAGRAAGKNRIERVECAGQAGIHQVPTRPGRISRRVADEGIVHQAQIAQAQIDAASRAGSITHNRAIYDQPISRHVDSAAIGESMAGHIVEEQAMCDGERGTAVIRAYECSTATRVISAGS